MVKVTKKFSFSSIVFDMKTKRDTLEQLEIDRSKNIDSNVILIHDYMNAMISQTIISP